MSTFVIRFQMESVIWEGRVELPYYEAFGPNVVEIVFVLPVFVIKCLYSHHPKKITQHSRCTKQHSVIHSEHCKACSSGSTANISATLQSVQFFLLMH